MIMKAPARKKPEKARRTIQASGSTSSPFSRMMIAAQAAEQEKARIWPTRRTTTGAMRQPSTKPVAQPVPISPSSLVENPSSAPRIGRSSECRPLPASRNAVEKSSARMGRSWRAKKMSGRFGGWRRDRSPLDHAIRLGLWRGLEFLCKILAGGEDRGVGAEGGGDAAGPLVVRRAAKVFVAPRAGADGDAAEHQAPVDPAEVHAAGGGAGGVAVGAVEGGSAVRDGGPAHAAALDDRHGL